MAVCGGVYMLILYLKDFRSRLNLLPSFVR